MRKLIHRHPHVFGDVDVAGADEVLVNWERLKAEETGGRTGVEEDIPASLPALARAAKVQRRAAGWGFAWRSTAQIAAKLREEVGELEAAADDPVHAEEELGDVLLAVVAVARRARPGRRVGVAAGHYDVRRPLRADGGAGGRARSRPRRPSEQELLALYAEHERGSDAT